MIINNDVELSEEKFTPKYISLLPSGTKITFTKQDEYVKRHLINIPRYITNKVIVTENDSLKEFFPSQSSDNTDVSIIDTKGKLFESFEKISFHIPPVLSLNGKNRLSEKTLSFFVTSDNKYIAIVRLVNYTCLSESSSFLFDGENKYNSEMVRIDGSLDDFNVYTSRRIKVIYPNKPYGTYWTGVEDIRFINETKVTCVVPEMSPDGMARTFEAELKEDSLIVKEKISEEKFCLPYEKGTVEKSIAGTNGIFHNGLYIFIISDEKRHKFMTINSNTGEISVKGEEFHFFDNSFREIVMSLAKDDQFLYIGVGVDNYKTFVVVQELRDSY